MAGSDGDQVIATRCVGNPTKSFVSAVDGEFSFHKKKLEGRVSAVNGLGGFRSSTYRGGGVGRNRSKGDLARKNRLDKCLKVRSVTPSYMLGKDIALDKVVSMASKALIGKVFYIKMWKAKISQWIQDFGTLS
jgi:hypothetical protein